MKPFCDVGVDGFEPPTLPVVKPGCSESAELNSIKKGFIFMKPFVMWELTGSNRRPSACKADALNQLS